MRNGSGNRTINHSECIRKKNWSFCSQLCLVLTLSHFFPRFRFISQSWPHFGHICATVLSKSAISLFASTLVHTLLLLRSFDVSRIYQPSQLPTTSQLWHSPHIYKISLSLRIIPTPSSRSDNPVKHSPPRTSSTIHNPNCLHRLRWQHFVLFSRLYVHPTFLSHSTQFSSPSLVQYLPYLPMTPQSPPLRSFTISIPLISLPSLTLT